MSEFVLVLAATLVEDFSFYPRHGVDNGHVQDLARALRAGVILPPVVADRASKRISDGFHRKRAHVVVGGPTAQIPVIWVDYKSDADLFADAVRRNASHGRRLDRQDEIRCTIRAAQLGLTDVQIAAALQVLPERAIELRAKVVIVDGDPIPIKPVLSHLQGKEVRPEQAEGLRKFGGLNLRQHISQLEWALETELFDRKDQVVLNALHALARLITEKVPTKV